MIRLPEGLGPGSTGHGGWQYAIDALAPLCSPDGLLFDDWIERTFLRRAHPAPWREPWIGVAHTPFEDERVARLRSHPAFLASLPFLVGLVTLSAILAEDWRRVLAVPAKAVRYPAAIPAARFDPDAYRAKPTVVQVGGTLRHVRAIYALPVPRGVTKVYLRAFEWIARREAAEPDVGSVGETVVLGHLPRPEYETLLLASVVFMHLKAAAGSTTLVECIARTTPVLVNRLRATEEYLGRDYPLFYNELSEAPRLLTTERVRAAHAYLAAMDRSWLDPGVFREQVADFVGRLARSPRAI